MRLAAPPINPPEFVSKQVTAARRFYLNLKPRAAPHLTVICGGMEEVAPDYVIERSNFPYFGLEFVASGAGELVLQGKAHPLRAGSVFVYNPRVPHAIRTAREPRLVKYFVDFIGRPAEALLTECRLKPGTYAQVAAVGDVREGFDDLIRLGSLRDARTERTCALRLELLLYTIVRSRQVSSASDRRARATFERVRECMDSRFLELAAVADVAAACHLDSSHLSRLVRRFQHEAPLHYLRRRRMQWAAERLQTSDLLIREVADELGMDPFHFSRAFKGVHGIPPTEFLALHG